MNTRRRGIAGLLAVALLLPGLAACATEQDTKESSSSESSKTPQQALVDSTKGMNEGNFRFAATGLEFSASGNVHKPSRSAQAIFEMSEGGDEFSVKMELVYIEPDSWAKIDMPGLAELLGQKESGPPKYQHLDSTRIKDIEDLTFDFNDVDMAGSAQFISAIVDVREAGAGAYSGTVDLTKATDAGLADEEVVKALGADAAKVPFTAKLDGEGRLTELVIQVPAVGESKAHELKVTYEYGAASAVQKPPADEIVEATEETYKMFQ